PSPGSTCSPGPGSAHVSRGKPESTVRKPLPPGRSRPEVVQKKGGRRERRTEQWLVVLPQTQQGRTRCGLPQQATHGPLPRRGHRRTCVEHRRGTQRGLGRTGRGGKGTLTRTCRFFAKRRLTRSPS